MKYIGLIVLGFVLYRSSQGIEHGRQQAHYSKYGHPSVSHRW